MLSYELDDTVFEPRQEQEILLLRTTSMPDVGPTETAI